MRSIVDAEQRETGSDLADPGRFRVAFDNAAVGLSLTSPDGVLLEVNEQFASMLGVTRRELQGARVVDITHPDDIGESQGFTQAALAGEIDSGQFEKRFRHADGHAVPALLTSALVRDDDGHPQYFTAQVLDLTEKRASEQRLAAAEQRQRLILANLPGTVIALYDRYLRVLRTDGLDTISSAHTDLSVRGAHLSEFFTPDAFDSVKRHVLAALDGETTRFEHIADDGSVFAVDAAPFRDGQDSITGALTVWRDVTAQAREHQARVDAEHQLRQAFEEAPIGMALVGLDGAFERVNQALCDITGYSDAELARQAPFTFIHPEDLDAVRSAFASVAPSAPRLEIEHRIVTAAGSVRWTLAKVTLMFDTLGRPLHVLAQVQDVTERRDLEERLRHLADHDPLTGLLNRRGFGHALDRHIALARRHGPQGALLMLDLDEFKAVNDRDGHEAGDRLLVTVAEALRGRVRETDTLARLGGDEFAVILHQADSSSLRRVADDLIEAVNAACPDGASAAAHISVGGAPFTADSTASRLLAQADRAMYQAKRRGGHQAVLEH